MFLTQEDEIPPPSRVWVSVTVRAPTLYLDHGLSFLGFLYGGVCLPVSKNMGVLCLGRIMCYTHNEFNNRGPTFLKHNSKINHCCL